MTGFPPPNLKYMRRFVEECPAHTFEQQPADQLPRFHLVVLITRLSKEAEREWYATDRRKGVKLLHQNQSD